MGEIHDLRIYTLKTPEDAAEYAKCWQFHVKSLPLFGFQPKAVWRSKSNPKQVFALVAQPEGLDVKDAGARFMQSAQFQEAIAGWDTTTTESFEQFILEPLEFSPLK